MSKKSEVRHIDIVLHHDFLKITDREQAMQLPLRTAKLISDMYLASGTDDEQLEYYAGSYPAANPTYTIGVFNRHVEYGSSFKWLRTFIYAYVYPKK